jgi:hypothetical protein
MRHIYATLLVLGFAAASADAKKEIDWMTARVLDSHTAKTYVESSASTNTTAASSTTSVSQTKINTMAIQETQLLIAGSEYAYLISDPVTKPVGLPTHGIVTRAIANRGHGCRFVVGDDIRFYQEKSALHVVDADGKECKLDILRQERLK